MVIEIVSNREGEKLGHKKRRYARMRIAHYVVWDPAHHLGDIELRTFELRGDLFMAVDEPLFEALGLGLVLWNGTFEGLDENWLRWKTTGGLLLPTGAESAEAERRRADAERERAQLLREKLLELGVDPDADD